MQVNKAQNPQKGLNPSRSKDAKGVISNWNWFSLLFFFMPSNRIRTET